MLPLEIFWILTPQSFLFWLLSHSDRILASSIVLGWSLQGAKKVIFTACHSGNLKLEFTSPDVISTSPKNFLTSIIDFTVLLLFEFLKNITCPSGKLKTEFTILIAKSTSPGLSDTTFFAHWALKITRWFHQGQFPCLKKRLWYPVWQGFDRKGAFWCKRNARGAQGRWIFIMQKTVPM